MCVLHSGWRALGGKQATVFPAPPALSLKPTCYCQIFDSLQSTLQNSPWDKTQLKRECENTAVMAALKEKIRLSASL